MLLAARSSRPAGIRATATALLTLVAALGCDDGSTTPSNPTPVIVALSPSGVASGSGATSLSVIGTGFVPGSIIRWNGFDRPTLFESDEQLSTVIPASDLATLRTAQITVTNPGPAGGVSVALPFTIGHPAPTISSYTPVELLVGYQLGELLVVRGTGFRHESVVRWQGQPRPTSFVSDTEIRAGLTAADLATAGTFTMDVHTPPPGGGTSATLAVEVKNWAPAIFSLDPASASAGSGTVTVTIDGSRFIPSTQARWNGSPRPTTFVHTMQLKVEIPASDLAAAGTATLSVVNPPPGGGEHGLPFLITP